MELFPKVAKSVKDILIMPPDSNNDEKPIKVMEKMLGLLPHDTIPCWLFQFIFLQKLPEVLRCKLARLDQEFLGTCNFYILSFATIALPLPRALAGKPKKLINRDPALEASFNLLITQFLEL